MTGMMSWRLPTSKSIKDLLEGMLGREVQLKPSNRNISPVEVVGGLIATYSDDQSRLVAILGWSCEAGAQVGCALGLVPAPLAKEMIDERYLRGDIAENISEVSNVISASFADAGNPHVRMTNSYRGAAEGPAELAGFLFTHSNRHDYQITVKGYGTGVISLVLCA